MPDPTTPRRRTAARALAPRALAVLGLALAAALGAGALATLALGARAEARHPPTGRFVPVPGGRLHVVERGPADAPPHRTLVLLHGASGNALDPLLALEGALPEFRLVAFDRPGHGHSDRPGGDADAAPARQAALIDAALGAMGIERALVMGHSWSGALALALALDRPDRVAGLLLLSPASHPWPGGAVGLQVRAASAPALGALLAATVVAPVGALALAPVVEGIFAPQRPPEGYVERTGVALVLRPAEYRANAADVAALHAAVSAQAPRYPSLRPPVAVVTGDADTIVWPDVHSRGLARDVPGATLTVLPGVGHMPHWAAPAAVAGAARALGARSLGAP